MVSPAKKIYYEVANKKVNVDAKNISFCNNIQIDKSNIN